jgi:hypothetical protein
LSSSVEPGGAPSLERRLYWIGAFLLLLVIVFTMLGAIVSPNDENGRPVLLLPDVKAFEDYRRLAHGWLDRLEGLDSEISSVLSESDQGDLFTQSRNAQQLLQDAVNLAQEIDRVKVPAAAAGIHDQLYATALAYLEIARLTVRWVGVPEETQKDAIKSKLDQSRAARISLEKSPWLNPP